MRVKKPPRPLRGVRDGEERESGIPRRIESVNAREKLSTEVMAMNIPARMRLTDLRRKESGAVAGRVRWRVKKTGKRDRMVGMVDAIIGIVGDLA